ncbi:ATP-binding cassette domain-containing protein [uncultured Methanolobus sp.]|uniref:ATP-binding cassette domain-containing protein n=1 Tax=uncultured Methanolobus sp. TaxID=218300 RepID=UPI002AABD374|nr:ATP-binding cassette domain-containing protein [uncultured Methanolobus sp.]
MNTISINRLTKKYGNFTAVDDVSFYINDGEIFGLLGPNGAGKTTTLKAITTLGKPSSGSITAFGIDVVKSPKQARKMFGYVPQAVSADGDLTGYENLLIFAKLFYVNKNERDKRINTALEYMGLSERSHDLVNHYSGGMMRRLEIAQALVNRPKVLFLDEPSIGLDPSSKRQVWKYIKRLNEEFGMTIIITTHDMVEADELCHRIAIMNSGKIAVIDTPFLLKKSIGGDIISLSLMESARNVSIPDDLGLIIDSDNNHVLISTDNSETAIPKIIRYFEVNGIVVSSVTVNKQTLDDVFMKYARSSLQSQGSIKDTRSVRRSFVRRGR